MALLTRPVLGLWTTVGRVSSFPLLEGGSLVGLTLLLVERLLLIACRVACGLLLGDLDEVGPRLLPLDSLQWEDCDL